MKLSLVLSIALHFIFCVQVIQAQTKYVVFLSSTTAAGNAGLEAMDNICRDDHSESRALINRGNGILAEFPEDAIFV
jgi:hypothetical protein